MRTNNSFFLTFARMKQKYIELAAQYSFPIQMQPWWLDIVSMGDGKDWGAIVVSSPDGRVSGAMAYHVVRKRFVRMALVPQLTPSMGIWFNHKPTDDSYTCRQRETAVLEGIAQWFDDSGFHYVDVLISHNVRNLLPFSWRGFSLQVRYTFVTSEHNDMQHLKERIYTMKRRQINKAQRSSLCYVNRLTPECYYDTYSDILKAKGEGGVTFQRDFFLNLASEALQRSQAAIFSVHNQDDEPMSALFCVWDDASAYALSYWTQPAMLNSGSSALVMYEAMRYLSGRVALFDFEGSMDRGISNSYAMFATQQYQLCRISKSYGLIGWLVDKMIQFRTRRNNK